MTASRSNGHGVKMLVYTFGPTLSVAVSMDQRSVEAIHLNCYPMGDSLIWLIDVPGGTT